jgi:hypothetical protein
MSNVREPGRFVNQWLHVCGCETEFDTLHWRSAARKRCDEHAAKEAHHVIN